VGLVSPIAYLGMPPLRRLRSWRALVLFAITGVVPAAPAQCAPDWIPLPPGNAPNDWVYALHTWDPDGPGPLPPRLVVGGNFSRMGATTMWCLGAFDGASSAPIGDRFAPTVYSLGEYVPPGGDPNAPDLIVGSAWSSFNGSLAAITRWDGTAWHDMPGLHHSSGWGLTIYSMVTFQSDLWVAGIIDSVNGAPAHHMALWNGAQWDAVPHGLFVKGQLHIHGDDLYAGGIWTGDLGLQSPAGIARRTADTWSLVGTNYPPECISLATYQGLLICGSWREHLTPNIFAWDGLTWSVIGGGTNGSVRSLAVFDPDGPSPLPELLILGGGFTTAGGQQARGIAAWDGNAWLTMGAGVNGRPESMAIFDGHLYIGGRFTQAGGIVQPYLARWGCPQPPPCYANCDHSSSEPILNVEDFLCFIAEFAAASALSHPQQIDHYANCDGSTTAPVLNVEDFLCFITEFAAGCP
jgi:hypothetical protein